MVDKTQFQPQNPYGLFDPSQWSNAYSNYNNSALPWPSRYAGLPTDAMGNPIGLPAGTTLNTPPAQPAPAPQQGPAAMGQFLGGGGQGAPQAAPAAPAQAGPDYNTVLSMLANPGKVTTPGATVPAAPVSSAQSNPAGLQSFLAGFKPAQSGPGSGFQQGFANALKGMGY
jgi:hypothetical protein